MPLEDAAQQEILPRAWRVLREPLCCCCPVCVADHGSRVVPEAVHPVIAHAVAELLAGTASNRCIYVAWHARQTEIRSVGSSQTYA